MMASFDTSVPSRLLPIVQASIDVTHGLYQLRRVRPSATVGDVMRMILAGTLRVTLVGVAIGLAASIRSRACLWFRGCENPSARPHDALDLLQVVDVVSGSHAHDLLDVS
jgi:hypothetical protein